MYCNGVTAKPSGSLTPVAWFGQYPVPGGTSSRLLLPRPFSHNKHHEGDERPDDDESGAA